MWLRRETYKRLVAEAALALQVPKLELRAEAAEKALASEREENRRSERHWASMWLRHQKTYPLPPTKQERAEAKAEKAERDGQPPRLTEDQQARLKASIDWGKRNGFTQEQAEAAFMAQLGQQVDE